MPLALTALSALVALLALGCARARAGDGLGSMSIVVREAAPRVLMPAGDFDPTTFLVTGSGPEGAAFSRELAGADVVVQDLAVGTWTVAATARNAVGEPVGSGEGSTEVFPGETRELAIVVTPLSGIGAVELAVGWEASRAAEPRLHGELVPAIGDPVTLILTVEEPGRASCATTEVPAAWYTLLVRLYDGEALVSGAAEAVLVRAAVTTRGSVNLGGASAGAPGALGLGLTALVPWPLPVVMAGQLDAVAPLQELCAETSAPEGTATRWYLDGQPVWAGPRLDLTSPVSPGDHRLDAVLMDAGTAAAGSVSHTLRVGAPAESGLLCSNFVLSDGEGGVSGLRGARCAAVSPDGAYVYASGYDSGAVAILARSTATGLLRYVGRVADGDGGADGLDGADGIALSPDGRHLYVAGTTADAVAAFRREPSGALAFVGRSGGLDGARALAVSPDGAQVYATLSAANAVAVLARDSVTGALSLSGTVVNGSPGVTLLGSPTEIAVSADGAHVYVSAYTSDAVLWFTRDATTGMLAPLGALRDGEGGVDGLNGAHGLAISPDGRSVLVSAYYDRALTVFARDVSTGALSFVTAAVDGVDGVDGLSYARDVVVAPGGAAVYVSGGGEDAVATFRLDPSTRALSFLGAIGVPDGPRGLSLSPDGQSLYACSATAGCLAALRVAP